ncbi:MAG TPA: hypothetical protein VJV79_27460 [Polyangiaceae bacterium]|nr:hypothetical protein [Polyangiaceae bacterium]
MKQCSALVTCLPILALLCVSEARAESECSGAKPWVSVSGNLPAAFVEAVRSDLRAGLAPSNIDVCDAPTDGNAPEPLARVVLEQIGSGSARYSLDVTDSVTQKRVGRDLTLDKLPADGRAFALAVAADELLRATWAELALRGSSQEAAAPPEVRAIVEKSGQPPAPPRRPVGFGARLGFEHFLGGQTHYGVDLFGVVPLAGVAGGFVALGARRALSEQALNGSIAASALSAELGLSLAFVQRGGFELSAFVSGRLLRVNFEPEAESGAAASAAHGLAVTSRVGLGLAFGRLGVLRSYSTLGAGLPLKSFSAADTQTTVTGVSKLELFASTGLALELP